MACSAHLERLFAGKCQQGNETKRTEGSGASASLAVKAAVDTCHETIANGPSKVHKINSRGEI